MTWAGEALAALRKIITLEERVATFTDDIHDPTRIVRDLDHRLVKLETKLEVYERLSEKSRSRRLPSQD
jgi:precorrin-6B methylase 1